MDKIQFCQLGISASIALTIFLFTLAWNQITIMTPIVFGDTEKIKTIDRTVENMDKDLDVIKAQMVQQTLMLKELREKP